MTPSPEGAGEAPFRGRVVAITGASSGLGARLAEAFAAEEAELALFARSEDRLRIVAEACRAARGRADHLAPGRPSPRDGVDGARVDRDPADRDRVDRDSADGPLTVSGDVADPDACRGLVDAAVERFGRLDVLVACAGVSMWARFEDVEDLGVFRRLMEVNYLGLVYCARFALPHLRRSEGILVAVSSVQGTIGVPYHTGYAAAKHAVQGFCDSLRMELRDSGVDVLTVLPHWIRGTRLRERAFDGRGGRHGSARAAHGDGALAPEEVARRVLEAARRRDRALYLPGKLRYLPCLAALAPALADRLIVSRVDREGANRAGSPPDAS